MTTLNLDELPVRVDYREAARLVTLHFFPISPRTLEGWDLRKLKVNGRNTVETVEVFDKAQARLDAARAA